MTDTVDVEACAGLLAELANNPDFYHLHPRAVASLDNLRHFLLEALPGMGKDSDEFREACRAGGIACAGEREAARDEGRLDDAREWERFATILHARARAAQPQETKNG